MATVVLRNTVAQVQEPGAREWDAGEDKMFPVGGLQLAGYDHLGDRITFNLYRELSDDEAALYLNLGVQDALVLRNILTAELNRLGVR